MRRPELGGAPIAPEALFLRTEGSEGVSYVKIDNWGKTAPTGLYSMCVKLEADPSMGTTLISKPRLEAYDSFEAAFKGTDPESPILTGTDSTVMQPLLRAIDVTGEAQGITTTANWPPANWWFDAGLSYGGSDDNRIKYIEGSNSFLEPSVTIVPAGGSTIIEGTTYTTASSVVSTEFYFSVAPVIPSDVTRGQSKKDILILIRTFFA